ncbi:MAG: hypothetical protein V1754_13785 [Pseudomonadota bacterium]
MHSPTVIPAKAGIQIALICLLLLFVPGTSQATLTIHLTLPKLAQASDAIVEGEIQKTYCKHIGKNIFTFAVLQVDKWHRGNAKTDTILVRVPGGRIGDRWMAVDGMPNFKKGERVFLFLLKQKGFWWTLGAQQGKFLLAKDDRGELQATRTFEGGGLLHVKGPVPQKLSYRELLFEVRLSLERKTP